MGRNKQLVLIVNKIINKIINKQLDFFGFFSNSLSLSQTKMDEEGEYSKYDMIMEEKLKYGDLQEESFDEDEGNDETFGQDNAEIRKSLTLHNNLENIQNYSERL